MLLITLQSSSPFFNFAAEEYLLKQFPSEDFFITYINEESVSVGLNQNTLSEINAIFIRQNNIKVLRRNSGGGTVYHDKACLNFAFISKNDESAIDEFTPLAEILVNFFNYKLNLNTYFGSRNDIFIDGKKICGLSKYKHEGRMLQHGNILFASNLKNLNNSIKQTSKIIKESTETNDNHPVINIKPMLSEDFSLAKFREILIQHVKTVYSSVIPYELVEEDIENINTLASEKYATWDWNYGTSPEYDYKKVIKCPCGTIEVMMKVEKGIINEIKIYGDFFSEYDISEIQNIIKGNRHKCDDLLKALRHSDLTKYFGKISNRYFVENLF